MAHVQFSFHYSDRHSVVVAIASTAIVIIIIIVTAVYRCKVYKLDRSNQFALEATTTLNVYCLEFHVKYIREYMKINRMCKLTKVLNLHSDSSYIGRKFFVMNNLKFAMI